MSAIQYVQTLTLYLSGSGVVAGDETASLTTFTDIYGNQLSMADFGSKGYITFEPDTTNEEAATFTGVTQNENGTFRLDGVSTLGATFPYTETLGLIRSHSGGTKVVITDNVGFWNTFANKYNDETIFGTWVFNSAPSSLSATRASVTALGNVKLSDVASQTIGTCTITIASPAVITKSAHGLQIGDSVQFTTTGALPTGITTSQDYYVISDSFGVNSFEVSLTVGGAAVNTSGSQSGTQTLYKTTPVAVVSNDNRLPENAFAQSGSPGNDFEITLATAPTAYRTGQIFYFQSAVETSGPVTLNVNGLGAKAVVKFGDQPLATGDIRSTQLVGVMYDGTAFNMISPPSQATPALSSASYAQNSSTRDLSTSSGNQVIAHGLGVAPARVRIRSAFSGVIGSLAYSDGTFAGGVYSKVSYLFMAAVNVPVISVDTVEIVRIYDPTDATGNASQSATITVDATNITIAWTKHGSPTGIASFVWEADAFNMGLYVGGGAAL